MNTAAIRKLIRSVHFACMKGSGNLMFCAIFSKGHFKLSNKMFTLQIIIDFDSQESQVTCRNHHTRYIFTILQRRLIKSELSLLRSILLVACRSSELGTCIQNSICKFSRTREHCSLAPLLILLAVSCKVGSPFLAFYEKRKGFCAHRVIDRLD